MTYTNSMLGSFRSDARTRQEFLSLVGSAAATHAQTPQSVSVGEKMFSITKMQTQRRAAAATRRMGFGRRELAKRVGEEEQVEMQSGKRQKERHRM